MPDHEPGDEALAPTSLLRRMYAWVLSWAASPYGVLALFLLSFAESSFFPIPPDPLLMALCIGARRKSLYFAAVCTAASVLGGVAGYYIGQLAFDALARPIVEFYGAMDEYEHLAARFRDVGGPAVLFAALTPVPYKLVTITAGAMFVPMPVFLGASIIGRGARFFVVAGLLWWKGDAIAGFIERWFEWLAVAFAVLLIGGFLAMGAL